MTAQETYEQLRARARKINIYMFDFNHTLEEGSEIALAYAINSARRKNGYPAVSIDQVLKLYGHPLNTFVQQFCPWITNVEGFAIELSKDIFEHAKTHGCMKPSEGAIEVLRTLKERGHYISILTLMREPIWPYLELLGLKEYVSGAGYDGAFKKFREAVLQSQSPDFVRAFLEQDYFIAGGEKAYHAYLTGRMSVMQHDSDGQPVMWDRRFFIGDSEVDMRSAMMANRLIEEEWKHYPEYSCKPRPKIESVLYNPRNKPTAIKPDYEITHLRQLLDINSL